VELQGKVAVVTGASSGIGKATVEALAAKGMTVVAVARRQERLQALAAEHAGVCPYPADVTEAEDVEALAGWVGEHLGACHVLVNNAGANFGWRLRGVEDAEQVRRTMDLNFGGTLRCTTAFAELLFASAPSRVVNVASVAGKLGAVAPGYAASKFATVGLSEALAGDWGRRGVTVSQVNPGFIETEGFPQDWLRSSRLGRQAVGEASDVADAIVEVAERGTQERTVPRWYRAAVLARHLCPPLYRAVLRRL
jgi:NAD(P)-dependent dehydrogenase (short-subunit alcohol dehydrogenase family)